MNRQAAILSRSVLLAATLLAAFLFAAGSRAQTTVTPIQNVSRDADNSVQPKIAQAPDGSVHAVWRQEPGVIKYAKGVWTGTQYSFGSSTILADTGNFGYATPTIAVAPNSTVMVAWTEPGANGELIKVQTWDGRASQPSGSARAVSAGRETVIAVDSSSQFHIVSNSNFQIKYCQWDGGAGCAKSDSFSAPDATGNNQPDIAVDSADVVHVVWMRNGNGIFTRTRASGAN